MWISQPTNQRFPRFHPVLRANGRSRPTCDIPSRLKSGGRYFGNLNSPTAYPKNGTVPFYQQDGELMRGNCRVGHVPYEVPSANVQAVAYRGKYHATTNPREQAIVGDF